MKENPRETDSLLNWAQKCLPDTIEDKEKLDEDTTKRQDASHDYSGNCATVETLGT